MSAFDPLRSFATGGMFPWVSKVLPRLKTAARFIGGLLVGIVGSATVAGWLFTVFEWLGVQLNPPGGRFGPLEWAAMLATWTAAEFAGQTIGANLARSVAVIWFIAATHAAILIGACYFVPHPALLAGAPLGFLVAYRIKDSDLVAMIARVPANS